MEQLVELRDIILGLRDNMSRMEYLEKQRGRAKRMHEARGKILAYGEIIDLINEMVDEPPAQ